MNENDVLLNHLIGKKVKVLYSDEGESKRVVGILKNATEKYLIVNDVIVGLGPNFIACIPSKEDNDG